MAKVALYLDEKTIPEFIEYTRNIVTQMTGNVSFPTPSPTLAAVTTAINQLESAYTAALTGDTVKKAIQDTKYTASKKILTELGSYVQDVSKGDKDIILSSGMQVAKEKAPVGKLPAPENLSATDGGGEGSLQLRWKKVQKATSYLLEISTDDNDPTKWSFLSTLTITKYLASGLPEGEVRYFRVAAINSAGQSDFSDVAKKRVP